MNIVCSPLGIVYLQRPGQGMMDIAGAGFENMLLDFTMSCSEGELENYGKKKKNTPPGKWLSVPEHPGALHDSVEEILAICKKEQINVPIARAPRLGRITKRTDLFELLLLLTEESIRAAAKAGSRYLIVRPPYTDRDKNAARDLNLNYYLKLAETAGKNQIIILLENQCRDVNGHLIRGICADEKEAAEWIDSLNDKAGEERFGFCMDVGALNLCGQDMREFASVLKDRIKAVLLRDCDGQIENSMLPFTAVGVSKPKTDWLGLIRGLRETGFDGELVIQFSDTSSVISPLLRPELVRFAKSVASYFKWQIEIENLLRRYKSIVLFGAGNMCRNYMKCYGEKYPPQFTCDNNREIWGTRFCGLTVKPPESLKDLPPDCAIFICNIYYREIELQLRELGVKNPIEFFNDEYMPSFYFDRLEIV